MKLSVSSTLSLKHFSLLDGTRSWESNYLQVLKKIVTIQLQRCKSTCEAMCKLQCRFRADFLLSILNLLYRWTWMPWPQTPCRSTLSPATPPQLIIAFLLFLSPWSRRHTLLSRNQQLWKNKQPFKSGSSLLLMSFHELSLLSPL